MSHVSAPYECCVFYGWTMYYIQVMCTSSAPQETHPPFFFCLLKQWACTVALSLFWWWNYQGRAKSNDYTFSKIEKFFVHFFCSSELSNCQWCVVFCITNKERTTLAKQIVLSSLPVYAQKVGGDFYFFTCNLIFVPIQDEHTSTWNRCLNH